MYADGGDRHWGSMSEHGFYLFKSRNVGGWSRKKKTPAFLLGVFRRGENAPGRFAFYLTYSSYRVRLRRQQLFSKRPKSRFKLPDRNFLNYDQRTDVMNRPNHFVNSKKNPRQSSRLSGGAGC
jgi:hypothetical protein